MKSNKKLLLLLVFVLATVCVSVNSSNAALKRLVSIAVTPADPFIALGQTEQFKATGTYSDSSTKDITRSVIWSSSAKSVATITNIPTSKGRATSKAAGTTTITAKSGRISGSTSLTVAVVLVSIRVTPSNPSITLGTAGQFTAIGIYSDNSAKDITTSVTWSSSDESVAAISNAAGSNGMATSVDIGTTTIKATLGSISGSTTLTVRTGNSEGNNVLPITVNGSLCSSNSYLNKPCVSVTICDPDNTSTCQTIDDILLDTGSFGLRIFKQALTVALRQTRIGSVPLAECVQFGDGSSDWGPIKMASVILGNEPAVEVPIQVIDATFGALTLPAVCRNADPNPAAAGFNGILGVGLFIEDCGSGCVSSTENQMYYVCNGSTCSGTSVPLSTQVQNPVAFLPQDNNGVIVRLPSIPPGGVPSVDGSLVLGISTQSNNIPSGVTAYPADPQVGVIKTQWNGRTYSSFIDSGSNGLFFPSSGLIPKCPSPNSAWFCPSSLRSFSATNTGISGSPSGMVSFEIDNFIDLMHSPNNVFADIGGNFPGGFDWGLPLFFGQDIYYGFERNTSSLGDGPYFAF